MVCEMSVLLKNGLIPVYQHDPFDPGFCVFDMDIRIRRTS